MMNKIKKHLIQKAKNTHKKIYPCKGKSRLEECFTVEGKKIIFWFNTEDCNTHTMTAPIAEFFALGDFFSINQQ
jgi:hypothetical protein